MIPRMQIRAMLAEGRCTLGIGRAFDVAMRVLEQPRLAPRLIECLWDEDEGVAGRAADALESVAGERPEVLIPFKGELLGLVDEAHGLKLRWHLGQIVLKLPLSVPECRRLAQLFTLWLDDPSSIVKTCAMQGLAELTVQDPARRDETLELLQALSRSGTPAMRARGRHLIRQMQKGERPSWRRTRKQAVQAARLVH